MFDGGNGIFPGSGGGAPRPPGRGGIGGGIPRPPGPGGPADPGGPGGKNGGKGGVGPTAVLPDMGPGPMGFWSMGFCACMP